MRKFPSLNPLRVPYFPLRMGYGKTLGKSEEGFIILAKPFIPIDETYTFETGIEGFRVANETHPYCVSTDLPLRQPIGHASSYSATLCSRDINGGILHSLGSCKPAYDFRGASVVNLDYWVLTAIGFKDVPVDMYDQESEILLVHFPDMSGDADVWTHLVHNNITEVLGHRVCIVFSKGYSGDGRYWDDIHIVAE